MPTTNMSESSPDARPDTPVVLSIAGSDSGAGAGIQADLKTLAALGVYGCTALTALTAQNTRGVAEVYTLSPAFVRAQIAAVLSDMPVSIVKTGMLANAEIIQAVTESLTTHPHLPLVLDPVMVASSGDRLLAATAVDALIKQLLPRAALLTPNLLESAALLQSQPATTQDEMLQQAEQLLAMGPAAVLLKGGHGSGPEVIDVLLTAEGAEVFRAPRLSTPNTHGTGCTLASAIAAGLARGLPLAESVCLAHTYLQSALAASHRLQVGGGAGPVHHFHAFY